MPPFSTRSLRALAAIVTIVIAAPAWAGSLTPPAGPVAPTFKTLTEVEPRIAVNGINTPGALGYTYRITQPGSYYLMGNVNAFLFSSAIEIASSDVTLDLNGFALIGTGATSSPSGVIINSTVSNVTVRNGTARGWPGYGFKLDNASNVRAIDLTASNNGGAGIALGTAGSATNCKASYNGNGGIWVSYNAIVTGCSASHNTGDGIFVGAEFAVIGCTSDQNTGNGFYSPCDGTFSGCTAESNTDCGFICDSQCDGGVTENCNSGNNGGAGFVLLGGASIHDCNAYGNTGVGIYGPLANSIRDCVVFGSGSHAIEVRGACRVEHNFCASANGLTAAGIHVVNAENHIDGNRVVACHFGIQAAGAQNIIVRNTCSSNNVNWSIVANNYYGPIIDRTGVATASVSGNAAAGTMGSTDPNANFTY